MGFAEWSDYLKRLARESRSSQCLQFDACSITEGLVGSMDGYSLPRSKLPWMSMKDWGWKAVVAAASDIAAAGGRPIALSYSVGLSSLEDGIEVARGVGDAAEWLGVRVSKSDFNYSEEGWIDVFVLGETARPVGRVGARPGMYVVQIGHVGVGLAARLVLEGKISLDALSGRLLEETRRPRPPVSAGAAISSCGLAAASDNSDGLAATIWNVAEASRVTVKLDRILVNYEALDLASSAGVEYSEFLYSWEDYNLIAVGWEREAECIIDWCRVNGVACEIVGRVVEGPPAVYFRGEVVDIRGWEWK